MKTIIKKMGINGEGIGYIDRTPVFIPQTLIDEEVEFKVVKKEANYRIGKVEKILKKNPCRITPINKQEYSTGGFPYMICEYAEQVKYKEAYLRESLIKYAQINPKLISPLVKSDKTIKYRNQLKLPFANVEGKLVTGLYQANSNYFTKIDISSIHEDGLERVRKKVVAILNEECYSAYNFKIKKGMRSLIIRGLDNQYQICLVTGEDEIKTSTVEKIMNIPNVVSLAQSVNTEKKSVDLFGKKVQVLAGDKYMKFLLNGYELSVSVRSFFQLNTSQAEKLYQVVERLVPEKNNLIVEAYSGIGAISLMVRHKANEVIGIEEIKDAVTNANLNVHNNHLDNISFLCADAADKLLYLSKTKIIDTLIVDPPRSGLDVDMLACIMKSKIKNIVYVSCNPATLAKNLSILKNRYDVKEIVPIDMFPQTPHVECVVLLSKVK